MPARSKRLLAGELVVLLVAGVVATVGSTTGSRRPPELFVVLLALAAGSDLLAIRHQATFVTFPLVGGLLIEWAAGALDVAEEDLAFSRLILGAFMVTTS